jgi:hypothetical protein
LVLGLTRVLLRSFILMFMTFIILMSAITHEFPPNLKRLRLAYQDLKGARSGIVAESVAADPNTVAPEPMTEESEIDKLSELYEKRARVGRTLLDPSSSLSTQEASDVSRPRATFSNRGEIEILKAQLLTCEDELALLRSQGTPSTDAAANSASK